MRVFLSRPHMSGFEESCVAEAFASNFVAPVGPQLDEFESSISNYLGGGVHCVALSSGSAALHLALRIAGVSHGDEVWVSSMTFAGGVFPINYLGGTPRFFDVSESRWTINVDILEDELGKASRENRLPKVIVPTDLYGQPADLCRIERLGKQYGVYVIVDSAESLGAILKNGRMAGSGGDASILSFNGNKIITSSGGGMLVTRHSSWATEARFLSTQARDPAPHYEHSTYGYNYRLSNICAAIGLGQLRVIEDRVAQRRRIFERYRSNLSMPGIDFMPQPEGVRSTNWLTTLKLEPAVVGVTREDVRLKLLEHEIEARPLWKPMHSQPLYRGVMYHGVGYDEQLFDRGICLPSGSDLSTSEQDEIIEHIKFLIK